jgi:hypothetical protein
VAEGAAASVSVELEEGVEWAEAAAEAIGADEEEEEDTEAVAAIPKNRCLARGNIEPPMRSTHCHCYLVAAPTVQQLLLLRPRVLYCRIACLLALTN